MIHCEVWCLFFCFLQQASNSTGASLEWPAGEYGLLKPVTGCPEGWKDKGWILQDTLDGNSRSEILNIDGYVARNYVTKSICIKTDTDTDTFISYSSTDHNLTRSTWPKGKYCMYTSTQNTLRGLETGSIAMYGEQSENKDASKYTDFFTFIEKSVYYDKSYIEFYFSCQTSGDRKIPIELPITKPFYLLPYVSRDCQQVKWMVATTEWIKYHTRNYVNITVIQKKGTVPYHELGDTSNKGITMHYCYYKSCNYTLSQKSGVFQSPGFPGKYPDGQLCSWRIMVPAKHTISVHFTNHSLYYKDCLRFYKNIGGSFKLNQTFSGHRQPFNITATRDLMFVFRSDKEIGRQNGFRAEYEILKIPERTTTAPLKSATTTLGTTDKATTTQAITKLVTTKLPTATQPQPTKLQEFKQPTSKLVTNKLPKTQQPKTEQRNTQLPITTKGTTSSFTNTNVNCTTNDTVRCSPTSNNHKSSNNHEVHTLKKTCICDETWRIVVMMIPLIGFILIVVVTIDIFCLYRYKNASKHVTRGSVDGGMVINPTYERGDITLDQTTDPTTDDSTITTVDDQQLSREEPPDYEDVDYTQVNDVPPPNRDTAYPECHALQTVVNDAPEVFYHVLEPPTAGLDRPTYQNLSEVNHYTLNHVYDSAENSAPLEAN